MVNEYKSKAYDYPEPGPWNMKRLDYREIVHCPCLKGNMMIGECRMICKWYKVTKNGEECEYVVNI